MARLDTNRSGEMEVFVRVVERGGFSAAAKDFNMTPSAVSKLVGRLEDRLSARLFNRSTRRLLVTVEGQRYYDRSVRILADMREAEEEAANIVQPKGKLRVSVNMPVGLHRILPLVPEFQTLYPNVDLDITVSDKVVDLYEERADIAIRSGPLQSSGLIARKLGECRMVIAAAPGYLERNGEIKTVMPGGKTCVGDAESARMVALAGGGIVRLAAFHIREDVNAGALKVLVDQFNTGIGVEIHAVYIGQGGNMPARVRAFLDFCIERVDLT